MKPSSFDETVADREDIEAAIEWLLLDRATYEERLAERWGEELDCSFRCSEPNKRAARLTLMVATREGDHRVSALEASDRIQTIFVEYASVASLQPGEYRWLDSTHLLMRSACKGEMVKLCIQALATRDTAFDYVAFVDDDVNLSATDLLEAADRALQDQITAFQLRLNDSTSSVWGALLKTPEGRHWKRVGFVEMMAPVLHQSALKMVTAALTNSYSGFGCDYYLAPILQLLLPDRRIAIWGGASMVHERPVQTTGQRVFASGLTASQEEERLRAVLLRLLLKPADPTQLTIGSLIKGLRRELSQKATPGGIERAFAATTHRHWCGQHDLAMVKEMKRSNEELTEELSVASSKLNAIETSKAWKAIELYRRCLNALRRRV